MRIALVQMKVIAGAVAENRRRGLALAQEGAARADVVVLPEIWTTGYALREVDKWAEDVEGLTISEMSNISRKYGAYIIAGSIPLRKNGKVYNGAVVIGPDGNVAAEYRKIHLFSMMGEERFFAAGDRRCTFNLKGVTAGIAICYDLRFPELFRVLALDGAQIVFLPAEWPTARGEHWHLLSRTRAIENQVFLCVVNCVGEHKGNPFYGHSMLIGPSGEVLAEGGEEETILYAEADFALVAKAREKMSVWQDRRPEVYL
ncbi:Nitrilase/cyanide hydratase and apolipoprotein N-acyltransferase [Thermosinus carboxydivorans Nor1]|uniref:Nitrilase/cyanide hydratase and apolipoprotein N-acyltransferase n=1 Tax=Thermosinus carboxydivorans Nor1 TaxID=401526 RepID=A1HQ26_9FIRM|nr:carbon-nitrogen family hydrolase [Thermosinus carboxydivorans]EAX47938.1 Nitrilase/cyanide hydratase and apolipoprotein N-acyltransferase [Thermosinus carboxydivorans Nor1]